MSNGKKVYYTFASGWLKDGKSGQYISATANGAKSKVKLFAQFEDGSTVPIDNFAVFFATEKDNEKSPDARFVFTQQ
jgi:hypothetical protein